ncbi:MAG: glycosyltransferase family 2 protein, partial [Chthoniobacterales bacterium]
TPNRGEQMNAGAARAAGDVLVFHHADTEITDAHFAAIDRAMRKRGIIGGAFYRKFDGRHPRLIWLEQVARFLTKHSGTLFGDQTVFVRREVFEKLGGYATIPLMEDVDFSRRLRAAGKVAVLDPPVRTSARRHITKGAWRTSIQNGMFILLYKIGVSPSTLHRWYYADRAGSAQSSLNGELTPELESLQR